MLCPTEWRFPVAGYGLGWFLGGFGADEPRYELLRKMPQDYITRYFPTNSARSSRGAVAVATWRRAVLNDKQRADDAWKSIDAMFSTQVEDGGFEGGGKLGDAAITVFGIRVESAGLLFARGGTCDSRRAGFAYQPHFRERFAALMPKSHRACDFIQKGYPTIIVKVGHTPNRLLIAAKAFGLCGIVLDDESMMESQVAWLRRHSHAATGTAFSLKEVVGIPATMLSRSSWDSTFLFTRPMRNLMPR